MCETKERREVALQWRSLLTAGASKNVSRAEEKAEECGEDSRARPYSKNKIKTRDRPAVLRGLVRGWPATQTGLESAQSLIAYISRPSTAAMPRPYSKDPHPSTGDFSITTRWTASISSLNARCSAMYSSGSVGNWGIRQHPRSTQVRCLCRFIFRVSPTRTRSAASLAPNRCASRSGLETAPALLRILTISKTWPASWAAGGASRLFPPEQIQISTWARLI